MIILVFSCSEKTAVEVVAKNDFCEIQDPNIKTIPYLLVTKSNLIEYKDSEIINLLGPKKKFPDDLNNSLIIFLGSRSSNIYGIKFLKFNESKKKIIFFVQEVIKDGNLTVETSPCLTIRVPKIKKYIEVVWIGEPLKPPVSKNGTIEYQ